MILISNQFSEISKSSYISNFDLNMDSNKILSNSNQMNNNTGLKNSNNQSGGRIMSSNVINSNNTIGAMNSKR